jgi:hypothetical protein
MKFISALLIGSHLHAPEIGQALTPFNITDILCDVTRYCHVYIPFEQGPQVCPKIAELAQRFRATYQCNDLLIIPPDDANPIGVTS